jgi:energy-coupling factor transport system permease protein
MNILTKFPIGQYVDGNRSWLRIVDSRLKIISVFIFLITPIWAGPLWRISLVICLIIITFISLLPFRVWWRSLLFLLGLSLIIGLLSTIAFSDIQSLDSSLRDPNELNLILESQETWNILEIPSKKIGFITLGSL